MHVAQRPQAVFHNIERFSDSARNRQIKIDGDLGKFGMQSCVQPLTGGFPLQLGLELMTSMRHTEKANVVLSYGKGWVKSYEDHWVYRVRCIVQVDSHFRR